MKKVALHNLGCKVNAYETEAMQELLEKHGYEIVPFQEGADVMFNSSLIYELAVLKQYVEPLLLGVSKDSPEYVEAKRLLKFLDYFVGIGNDNVPTNSLLRIYWRWMFPCLMQ